MAFCFSGSLLRANINIVFLVLYCYCSWQINFFFFLLLFIYSMKQALCIFKVTVTHCSVGMPISRTRDAESLQQHLLDFGGGIPKTVPSVYSFPVFAFTGSKPTLEV